MDFDKIYKKYVDGTATEDEKKYVDAELAKARNVLETCGKTSSAFPAEDNGKIQKAKFRARFKTTVTAMIVSFSVLIIAIGAVLGWVFGTSVPSAKENIKIDEVTAKRIAVEYVMEKYSATGEEVYVKDFDRDLHLESPLKNSVYYYEIELKVGKDSEAEIIIDASNGKFVKDIFDIDD